MLFEKLQNERLNREEQEQLLTIARNAILTRFGNNNQAPEIEMSFRLKVKRGVFVTLTKEQKLRGCIGLVHGAKPLCQAVKYVAGAAAFEDPRFKPLQKDELESVNIEISVIYALRRVKSIKKIKVPKHGLMIRLGDANAVLLPQVAEKNNWNRETFLERICLKAGLEKDSWKNKEMEIQTFEVQVISEQETGWKSETE